jgi:hypothetical protein
MILRTTYKYRKELLKEIEEEDVEENEVELIPNAFPGRNTFSYNNS